MEKFNISAFKEGFNTLDQCNSNDDKQKHLSISKQDHRDILMNIQAEQEQSKTSVLKM